MKKRWIIVLICLLFAVAVLSFAGQDVWGGKEQSSPQDWIGEEQIQVYPNQVVLTIPDALWARFTDTNSMDPFLDEAANAIEILPHDLELIQEGDVISYAAPSGTIIHRVISKGKDDSGRFFLVKGDNNTFTDPVKVRGEDIRGVVVAVIY